MEEIRKAIQSRHLQIEHNIYNMFKGGIAVPIGTVSMGRKKVAEGRWVEVSQGNTHKQIETLSTNISLYSSGVWSMPMPSPNITIKLKKLMPLALAAQKVPRRGPGIIS